MPAQGFVEIQAHLCGNIIRVTVCLGVLPFACALPVLVIFSEHRVVGRIEDIAAAFLPAVGEATRCAESRADVPIHGEIVKYFRIGTFVLRVQRTVVQRIGNSFGRTLVIKRELLDQIAILVVRRPIGIQPNVFVKTAVGGVFRPVARKINGVAENQVIVGIGQGGI